MAVRQAWAACKTLESETSILIFFSNENLLKTKSYDKKDKKEDKYDSDTDDECDPSQRRAALDEFRKRYNYSVPMHHQPSDKMFARVVKQYEKRLLPCFNLKDVVVILDQEMTGYSNPLVRNDTNRPRSYGDREGVHAKTKTADKTQPIPLESRKFPLVFEGFTLHVLPRVTEGQDGRRVVDISLSPQPSGWGTTTVSLNVLLEYYSVFEQLTQI